MQTRNRSFSESLNANIHKSMLAVNTGTYKIAKELFAKIVSITPSPSFPGPTAKGVLANNWFPVNGSGYSSAETVEKSGTGAGSLSRIAALSGFNFFRKDGAVTLSNNVHYAYRAEVLGWPREDGWSGRRPEPYRMVSQSMQYISMKYK